MMLTTTFVLIVTGVYLLNKYFMRFWQRRGFPQQNPTFFLGDTGAITFGKDSFGEYHEKLYQKTKTHDVFGYYFFYQPALLINNPELIQRILVSDFNQFHDRAVPVDEINDPLSGNLFFLPGQKRRDLRAKLTPSFTSGKLKLMFPIIQECVDTLNTYLKKNISERNDTFDAKNLFSRFTTNIISSVVFGIENDCINDPDHIIYRHGKRFFEPTLNNTLRSFSTMLKKIFTPKFAEQELETFFIDVVKETIEYREKEKIERNDFMNLLIQLKNQGYVSVDKDEDSSNDASQQNVKKLNLHEIAAQAFVFFVASLETSSSSMTFCIFEIAKNPTIQRKLQQEIDQLEEDVNYESITKMKYLEACIDETLRKYPAISTLIRKSTNDYRIPNSNLVIPKGVSIQIPLFGLHRDPDIYNNPLEFQPERFLNSPTGHGKAKGFFYLPFGDGPRSCIGMRLAKLMTKIGIATMLSQFSFELVDKKFYNEELKLKRKYFPTSPDESVGIRVSLR